MRKKENLYILLMSAVLIFFMVISTLFAEPRFLLGPGFSISEVFDDNIFSDATSKDWDLYTVIQPIVRIDAFLRLADLTLIYKPSFWLLPRHFQDREVREIFHYVSLRGRSEFSSGLYLEVSDSYRTVPFSYSESRHSPSNLIHSNEVQVSSGYQMELSPTVELSLQSDFARFDTFGLESNGMRVGGKVIINKDFSSTLSLGLVNKMDKYYYDTILSNPLIYGLEVAPALQLTGHIKCSFPFGYRYLWLGNIGNEHSFSYNVFLDYETMQGRLAQVFFTQEFLTDLSGNPFDRRAFGIRIEKWMRSNFKLVFSTSYSVYEDKVNQRTDAILEVGPALYFDLGRDFSFEVGYNGFYNKWGNSVDDFANNRFFMTLSYEKGKSEDNY